MNKLCPLGPADVGRIVNLFFSPACFPSCNYTNGALIHRSGVVRTSSQSPLTFVSALRRKLRSLPCSSFPHATRFAGLARGPRIRGLLRPADAMGKYLPQTLCAPAETEHPLCVCSVSAGLYPQPPTAEEGGELYSDFSLSHPDHQAECGPFGHRRCRLPERRKADQ